MDQQTDVTQSVGFIQPLPRGTPLFGCTFSVAKTKKLSGSHVQRSGQKIYWRRELHSKNNVTRTRTVVSTALEHVHSLWSRIERFVHCLDPARLRHCPPPLCSTFDALPAAAAFLFACALASL